MGSAVRLCSAVCSAVCAAAGITSILLAFGRVASWHTSLSDSVHDMMFIDNTKESSDEKGEPLAETAQFDAWRKGTSGTGLSKLFSVFNVTNAEAIVMSGAKPILQELGPVYAIEFASKVINASQEETWDNTGVATSQSRVEYAIDGEKCLDDCRALLDADVVVPNVAWASIVSQGLSHPFLFAAYLGGVIRNAGATAAQVLMAPVAAGGLGLAAPEAAAFAQVTAQRLQMGAAGMQVLLGDLGMFLLQASFGQGCAMGTHAMNATVCASIAVTVTTQTNPGVWAMTLQAVAPVYGTGNAAPVFMKMKVRQLLNVEGAVFLDPLLQMPIVWGAMQNTTLGLESTQMSSIYKEKGIAYMIKSENVSIDCRYDSDCWPAKSILALQAPDACQESETCKPLHVGHYGILQIPGRNFGSTAGFKGYDVGTTIHSMAVGILMDFEIVKEATFTDVALGYRELRLKQFPRRIENCDATGAPGTDSPGIDCDGPWGTLNRAPMMAGAPVYMSVPMFDSASFSDFNGMNEAQGAAGYDPNTKLDLRPCVGNAWCAKADRHAIYLFSEPETGFSIQMSFGLQVNLRIKPNLGLQSNVPDVVIPVYFFMQQVDPTDKQKQDLAALVAAPGQIGLMQNALIISGSVLLVGALACALHAYLTLRTKKAPETSDATAAAAVDL